LNPEDLFSQAQQASERAATAQENLPGSLEQFRRNLNEVYNKDNPLIKARESQLQSYLTAGDTARRDLLPQYAGGTVFTPTELQAIVSGRQAAALAPLSSLNQQIVGQYGGLKDYVGLGRDVLQAQISAAQQRSTDLQNLYQFAQAKRQQDLENQIAQQKFAEDVRQFGILHGGGSGSNSGINSSLGIAGRAGSGSNLKQTYGRPVTTTQYNRPAGPVQPRSYTPPVYMPPTLGNEPSFFSKIKNFLFPQPQPLFGNAQLNVSGPTNLNPNSTGYGGY